MARLLLSIDNGEYFSENGDIRPNLPIDYVKASTWELRPRVKVPHNENDQSIRNDSHTSNDNTNDLANGQNC